MSAINKLRYVHRAAPVTLQPRIARIIEAMERSTPQGVVAPVTQQVKVLETPISALQDNGDSFLALMRTLPKDHKFKKAVGGMQEAAENLDKKLKEAGEELSKILESDEEDLPGIKASALGELAEMLKTEGSKLSEITELAKMLNTLAGKVHKEEKTNPVEHDLPSKELKPKDTSKEEKSDDASKADSGGADGAMAELDGLFNT
jgi:GTP1/Obg family GTP-binding protein